MVQFYENLLHDDQPQRPLLVLDGIFYNTISIGDDIALQKDFSEEEGGMSSMI